MRAQVSLEYLVLSAVALGLLSVSIMALAGIKGSAMNNADLLGFRSSALSLANAINEVCALGSGNGREISVAIPITITDASEGGDNGFGGGFEDSGGGVLVRFSGVNSSIVKKSACDVDAADELDGLVYVKNEDGTVTVRGR